jgi:o-succinylbenzoate synthase
MKLHPYTRGDRKGIHIETETGWGEVAPLPGFSKETYEEALQQLQNLSSTKTLLPSVSFALDAAAHPVENHPVQIAHFGSDGKFHNCIKLKLAHLSLEEAITLVKETTPLCNELRVDMNRAWPLEKADAFCKAFPLGTFAFIEEPTSELPSLKTDHPIALDEHLREWPVEEIIKYPVVVIKPTMMGGYKELKPLINTLNAANVTPILSSSYETDIGLGGIIGLHKRLELEDNPLGIGTKV